MTSDVACTELSTSFDTVEAREIWLEISRMELSSSSADPATVDAFEADISAAD